MNINITLCGQLCETVNFRSFIDWCKGNSSKNQLKLILKDIEDLIRNPSFEISFLCNHILNKLVQLTGSEYGFLSEVKSEKGHYVLYTRAITNIAWNSASYSFFKEYSTQTLRFDNMDTLFGEVVESGSFKIFNHYDKTRGILPDGHPNIRRFMGVVGCIADHPIIMLGVCNKLTKYKQSDAKKVQSLLNILTWMFVNLHDMPKKIEGCQLVKTNSDSLNTIETIESINDQAKETV
jgi:hypothetical protein